MRNETERTVPLILHWLLFCDSRCKSDEVKCKEQIYHCDNTSGWFPSSSVCMCMGKEGGSVP